MFSFNYMLVVLKIPTKKIYLQYSDGVVKILGRRHKTFVKYSDMPLLGVAVQCSQTTSQKFGQLYRNKISYN